MLTRTEFREVLPMPIEDVFRCPRMEFERITPTYAPGTYILVPKYRGGSLDVGIHLYPTPDGRTIMAAYRTSIPIPFMAGNWDQTNELAQQLRACRA